MTDKVYNVLFLCTGNSARSIMAEAVLNSLGNGRFRAYSAGSSQPGGAVSPFAIEKVQLLGYPLENLRSKSWDELQKRRVFEKVFRQISTRIHVFISLPLAALDKAAIHRELRDIGATAVEPQQL